MKTEEKGITLSKESAEKEAQKFLDYYEISREDLEDGALIEAYDMSLPGFIKGIQKGFISFEHSEDPKKAYCVVQKLRSGTSLTYKELDGDAKVEMGKIPSAQFTKKIYTLLGKLSGEGIEVVKKLRGPDIKRAEIIGQMLLLC